MHLTLLHGKFFHSNQIIRYVGNIYKITNHQRYAYIVRQEKYKSKNGIIKETQIIFGIFFFTLFLHVDHGVEDSEVPWIGLDN